jgi:hypothetical protein
MNILFMALAVIGGLIVLAIAAAVITGRRQPSRPLYRHDMVIVAALRQDDPTLRLIVADALWTSSAQFTLIGEGEAYWTDYLILPPDTGALAALQARPEVSDLFVAEVELTQVPAIVPGILRLRHLLGFSRRPAGPTPTTIDDVAGRRELLPTNESIARARALASGAPVTMMNFLEYHSLARGDALDGRAAYLRYGREAFKAVHAVGGQFLFAGRVAAVLVPAQNPAWQVAWDDLAAMIYPDPTAIFAMEQFPFYRRALGERDAGLKRTRVIATRAY